MLGRMRQYGFDKMRDSELDALGLGPPSRVRRELRALIEDTASRFVGEDTVRYLAYGGTTGGARPLATVGPLARPDETAARCALFRVPGRGDHLTSTTAARLAFVSHLGVPASPPGSSHEKATADRSRNAYGPESELLRRLAARMVRRTSVPGSGRRRVSPASSAGWAEKPETRDVSLGALLEEGDRGFWWRASTQTAIETLAAGPLNIFVGSDGVGEGERTLQRELMSKIVLDGAGYALGRLPAAQRALVEPAVRDSVDRLVARHPASHLGSVARELFRYPGFRLTQAAERLLDTSVHAALVSRASRNGGLARAVTYLAFALVSSGHRAVVFSSRLHDGFTDAAADRADNYGWADGLDFAASSDPTMPLGPGGWRYAVCTGARTTPRRRRSCSARQT